MKEKSMNKRIKKIGEEKVEETLEPLAEELSAFLTQKPTLSDSESVVLDLVTQTQSKIPVPEAVAENKVTVEIANYLASGGHVPHLVDVVKASIAKIQVKKAPGFNWSPIESPNGSQLYEVKANLLVPKWVEVGELVSIPTGLTITLPPGTMLQLHSVPNAVHKHGLVVCSAPFFGGELSITVQNCGKSKVQISKFDKIALMSLQVVKPCQWEVK